MSSTEPTPTHDFYIHIGAPDPIKFQYREGGSGGTLAAFDSSLKMQYTNSNGTVSLGVGTGITLSSAEGVANALATAQLTVLQSRSIPLGAMTTYEIQRTVSGREEVLFMGRLVGEGGSNPDA